MLSSANVVVEFALSCYGDVAVMTSPRAFKCSLHSSLLLLAFAVSFTSGGGVKKDAAQLSAIGMDAHSKNTEVEFDENTFWIGIVE